MPQINYWSARLQSERGSRDEPSWWDLLVPPAAWACAAGGLSITALSGRTVVEATAVAFAIVTTAVGVAYSAKMSVRFGDIFLLFGLLMGAVNFVTLLVLLGVTAIASSHI